MGTHLDINNSMTTFVMQFYKYLFNYLLINNNLLLSYFVYYVIIV